MADKPTTSWDETTPAGSDQINAGDNRIREMKTQIREVVGSDHDFPSSGQDGGVGQHYRVTLQEQADLGTGILGSANTQSTEDNTNDVGICILGAQTCDDLQGNDPVTTKPELVFTDEDDDDVQITSNGKIHLDNGRLTNEAYLQARNADNDGDVDLIRARTLADTEESYTIDEDIVEVGTSMVIKGDLMVEGDTTGDESINGVQADNIIAREAIVSKESSGYTTDANEGALYTKNDGNATELYFKGESNGTATLYDNTEVQITKGGKLKCWNHSGVTVYSGSAPTSYTDLNLSNYVGSHYALIMLKITSSSGGDMGVAIRPNGDSSDYYRVTDPEGTSMGVINTGVANMLMTETGSDGIIEWKASAANTVTIVLMGFIR